MGWAEDEAKRRAALGAAERAREFDLDPGLLGGFASSVMSGIPELFGSDPSSQAAEFRAANPGLGLLSQFITPIPVYGGVYAASKLPKLAKALDLGTEFAGRGFGLAKSGINALDNPVAYGAVKEMVRYAPLELGRLGVGLATAPEENYGNLLADVGLSTVLAGGFGGIGGFFRAGGTLQPQLGRVVGADMALKPTFELRMSKTPGATVSGELPMAEVQDALRQRVLWETPEMNVPKGARARYVDDLEAGEPEADALVNSLFKVDRSKGVRTGLDRRFVAEGVEGDLRTLDVGQQQELVTGLGLTNIDEVLENTVYPRQVEVRSRRAAGVLAQAFDNSQAMQYVGDGVMMAREAEGGLWVVAKRIRAGGAEATEKLPTYGASRITEGDKWFVGKTDKPQLFAKELHKTAEATVAQWAKYREAFKPGQRDDVFNQGMDELLDVLTPNDYRDLSKLNKTRWVESVSEKLARKVGEETGLHNSARFRAMAEGAYDVFAPTMFKEAKDPVFGRLFGLMRGSIRIGDEYVSRIIKGKAKFTGSPLASVRGKLEFESGFEGFEPVSKLWTKLSDAERQLVVRASNTQTPAEDLAKLSNDGLISDAAAQVVKQLQDVNGKVWEKLLLPAFRGTELEAKFELLSGYILPRVFKGDYYVKVLDDKGRMQWLASGKNGKSAQTEANAVIAEAATRGQSWKIGEEYLKGAKHAAEDDMGAISDLLDSRLAQSGATKDIVEAALRRVDGASAGSGRIPGPGVPATLTKRRTGQAGTPDATTYSIDDVIKQSEDHYRRLLRFAGYHAWKRRWGQEALNLSKTHKTLYEDLMRKGNQYMGIEGQITRALDTSLAKVLGGAGGSRPATRIAQATNELMYNWNLAIVNPTFALLNLLTPLQTVAPWIAYATKAPIDEVAKHMHFVPHFDEMGRPRGVGQSMNPMKVLGAVMGDLKTPSPEFKEVLERMTTDGTLGIQQMDEWVGSGSKAALTLRETFKQQGGWEGIKRTATYMAEKSESYSRMVSAGAAYRVGKHHFGLEGEQLYRFAQQGVRVTNYGYSVVDRSRMFTGPIGSPFGLFKNWQFHFIGQMMQYAGVGMKHGTWGPLLWQGGAALALGGLGATPLKIAADGLAKWNSDAPSSYLWMQENWGDAADEIYFGLPALLGASLQASSTIPGTDVRNEIGNMSNFVVLERAKAFGKAVGAAWQYGTTTDQNAFRDPNIRDQMLAAVAPRAVFRAFSAMEGDYIKSMATGYPQVGDVGPSTRLLHGLGFNQLEVEREQVAARELWKSQEKLRGQVQALGQNYAGAMAVQDIGEMQRVIDRAMIMGVPLSSVMKSAQTRGRREEGDALDRFDAASVARYRAALEP